MQCLITWIDHFDLNILHFNIDFVIFRFFDNCLRFNFFQIECNFVAVTGYCCERQVKQYSDIDWTYSM